MLLGLLCAKSDIERKRESERETERERQKERKGGGGRERHRGRHRGQRGRGVKGGGNKKKLRYNVRSEIKPEKWIATAINLQRYIDRQRYKR